MRIAKHHSHYARVTYISGRALLKECVPHPRSKGRKARGRHGSHTNGALAQWLRPLCKTAGYVKAPNGRFTPQTLPGRGGLDARHGLSSQLCAQRLALNPSHTKSRAISAKYFNSAPVWKVSFQNKKIIDINKALPLK